MSGSGKLVVISGPSGAGKSSLAREVIKRTGAAFSVSVTTRPPREGEVDGRDYRFVGDGEFRRMVRGGELLEWAEVFGKLYGTPRRAVEEALAAGKTIILDVDVQGGRQVYEKMPSATFVLIVPPDERTLARRLRGRGTEDAQQLRRRLDRAAREVADARACGAYDCEVVNDEFDRAVEEVVKIVRL
jgi:guanylate kinase